MWGFLSVPVVLCMLDFVSQFIAYKCPENNLGLHVTEATCVVAVVAAAAAIHTHTHTFIHVLPYCEMIVISIARLI